MQNYTSKAFENALHNLARTSWCAIHNTPQRMGLYEVARMDIGRIEFMLWDAERWEISLEHPLLEDYDRQEWPNFLQWKSKNSNGNQESDWNNSFWRGLTTQPAEDELFQKGTLCENHPAKIESFVDFGASIYTTPRAKLLIEKVLFGAPDLTVKDLRKSLGIAEPLASDKDSIHRFFK